MKNRIFLLLLCVLAVSVMTADDSLYFPEGSRWTNASSEASYIIQGDTLVNGKKYHKVIDKNKDRQKLVALKREEGKKIYVRFEGTDTDVLLYDFGLEVGDSIVLQTDRCNGPCSINHVERIDTVTLLDGRKAKCFFYDSRMWDVEFVGCETGLFGPIYMPDIPTMYSDSYSYCFSINGKPIFETYPGICKSCGFTDKLPSLCDEWNVAERNDMSSIYYTYKWRLTTDTIINATNYVKLERHHQYKGALREDNNANIYIVYPGNQQECLLYAFNAQIGDTLTNTCLGRRLAVKDIHPTNPRIYDLVVEYRLDEAAPYGWGWEIQWIEGVGYSQGSPIQYAYMIGSIHELDPKEMIICAYKNGEPVYLSDSAETYGCEFFNYQDDSPKGIHTVISDTPAATKLLRDGNMFIKIDDKTYTLTGQEVK